MSANVGPAPKARPQRPFSRRAVAWLREPRVERWLAPVLACILGLSLEWVVLR
jgi:hypothetical protein